MAESPSHKFGQIIGDMFESAIEPLLLQFAQKHDLYLDKRGVRPARKGKKVSWTDSNGNKHDLDYVLEKGGSATVMGTPTAFIETAWRRYTKHSRNKAQEIQGAVLPLVETYRNASPFAGAILAGVFTSGALDQLKSLGFTVLYFNYDTVVEAFKSVGFDAKYDEKTPDKEFARKVRAWGELTEKQHLLIAKSLLEINGGNVMQFTQTLERFVTRRVDFVRVLPLHGTLKEWSSVGEAMSFIEGYDEKKVIDSFVRYEIEIRYNNTDRIVGEFADKETAIQFLRNYK